ncbi:hypothetical protein GCM10007972_23850 [Iodidimonas muriae]|uniref:Flagellar protein FlgJ N-terminal domain-containing protein n=1 Tax=Iodidimonas muriae TaxID=261467 RepID=A0ABQ2LFH5_9PROT|nr:rod-binding protein [Iodidimonas muriae]GER08573.1 hypothetical protein JCM17843_28830 [Kordiimonadales bacterium JCM 17843]GGO15582.1 hypothetical protein GCM10007972_23850 [Iodidimonas muriae]
MKIVPLSVSSSVSTSPLAPLDPQMHPSSASLGPLSAVNTPVPDMAGLSFHDAKSWQVAKEFEALMLGEMVTAMFKGMPEDGMFSGGFGESISRDLMGQNLGVALSESGGLGIAEAVYADIAALYSVNAGKEV